MRSIIVLSFVAAIAAQSRAEDTYTIKFKLDPDVGKTIHVRNSDTATGSTKFFDKDGKLLLEQKKEGNEKSYRSTVLSRDKDGKPTKTVRVYEKANETEDGKTKTFSYEGRTLLIERIAGKPRIGVVGDKPLDTKDVEKLYRDLDKKSESKALLSNLSPGKPVKVGDSWKVPVKPIVEAMDDFPADVEKSTVSAKLVKVYTKGKSQFGTFEIAMKFVLSGKTKEDDGSVIAFDTPGEFTVDLTLDAAIDGSSIERKEAGKLTMKGEASMTTGGQKLRMVFDMKGVGGEDVSAETDAPKAREVGKVVFLPAPGEWVELTSKDHAFKAKFPGQTKKDVKTNKEGITTTEYAIQIENGNVYYSVTVTDYPAGKVKLDATTAYGNLKKAENIQESSDIKIGGHAAVELKQVVKKEVPIHVTQRVVIVGQRMYQLIVVVAEGSKADAKQFFESFQIDEKALPKKDD